ncbi:glycosyltransferase [Azospirillum formosense]|uniref:Glycosyltransferase n=1 Tax=Azospirillum formosense TaxID=861533 RepID=A0ABX2KZ96_9PROT|nr:glycosyltransferase family 2 protein [Azospirillum formosense]MBY3757554.1 glycosyltransferase [Azospirillum formosense]MBY3757680.1 glycosyltransferase [Azospirillum formosense]NUB19535.1 glycosyltransferase [Azospirillum formosense]
MKVSVITICRNVRHGIGRTLESIAQQTYQDVEHIVIDGASTDGTLDLLEAHRDRIAVLVSEPDGGIYDAMNKGLARATGDVILFLNAEDWFYDAHSLENAVRFMTQHPEADLFYGDIEVRLPDGNSVIHIPQEADKAAETMICGCLPHQGTFARRSVFDRTGPFDTRWRVHADYEWFLKAIADDTITLTHMPVIVASFGLGGTSSNLAKGQPEVYAIQNALPFYQTETWLRRRVEIYQENFLAVRLENAELKRRLAEAAEAGAIRPTWRDLARRGRDVARRARRVMQRAIHRVRAG